ncbi:28S ribosomal protein S18c, mitochondrial-like [Rousettus aegyptiacus]|uniref:28S ribosomal protein S18c, mitochondrial-like n=1 Tax=Rousettus aegyptiacus TaxID=9407 RepID=UPI00078715FA|nr:28S ribosomal protein S18c, mitochondrial-like [Rousettus aegyptiacus]
MAAMVAIYSCLGKKMLTHFITATVCLPNPRTHMALWRSCSQYKWIASNEDLSFVESNKKKSQKQLRELK